MKQTLPHPLLTAAMLCCLALLCSFCSRNEDVAGPAIVSEGGRDTILFDTTVYINDTFTYSCKVSDNIDEIRWTMNNESMGAGRTFTLLSHDLADTGDKFIVGFIFFSDGAIDTERIILNLAAGFPSVRLTLADSTRPDTLFTDSLYHFLAVPSDPNGSVIAFLWDMDHDGVFEDTNQENTFSRLFHDAGDDTFVVRVMDDDSLVSLAETLTVRLSRGAPAIQVAFDSSIIVNQLYIGQQIPVVASALDPHGMLVSLMWDTTGDTIPDRILALDSGIATDTLFLSFSDSGYHSVSAWVRDDDSLTSAPALLSFYVRRGEPTVSYFSFTGYFLDLDSLLIDTAYDIAAVARDQNGTIRAFYWDADGNGAFDDTVQTDTVWFSDTLRRTFTIPGTYSIKAMAMDNNSFFSLIDSIVFSVHARHPDTMINLFDTLSLGIHPGSGKTIDSVAWVVWPDQLISTGDSCAYSASALADTGTVTLVARVWYSDSSHDTERVIVQVNSGRPEASVSLGGPHSTLYKDSLYTLIASALDANGSIMSFHWDVDNDGIDDYVHPVSGTQDSVVVDSLIVGFPAVGSVAVAVRAVDNDSLASLPARMVLYVQEPPASKRRVGVGR